MSMIAIGTFGLVPLAAGPDDADDHRLGPVVRLRSNGLEKQRPAWSPDGSRFAFGSTHGYPALSPDGRRLAFVSDRDGQYEFQVATADCAIPVNLSRQPRRDTYPTSTPDGRGVTFVSDRDGGTDPYTRQIGP